MRGASATASDQRTTSGAFNYLDASVLHSLFRNGEVLTRRDRDGSDAGSEGVKLVAQNMAVHDARQLANAQRRTIASHGFELLQCPTAQPDLDFFSHDRVVHSYYEECARLVQASTGATRVFAFDHNVRSAAGKSARQRITGGQQVQGPAHVVHGDYTLVSAPERLQALANPPSGNDTLRSVLEPGQSLLDPAMVRQILDSGSRFSIINVWRNIAEEPVRNHPLALCDAQSVQPNDLVVFEIHYHDRIGENYFAKHSPQHQWYFYPYMSRDEALLIKQWDSEGPFAKSQGAEADCGDATAPCTFSFHSAFEDPSTPPQAPERWSIEVRCIALYI